MKSFTYVADIFLAFYYRLADVFIVTYQKIADLKDSEILLYRCGNIMAYLVLARAIHPSIREAFFNLIDIK